jgi:hypothetical protein
MILDREYLTTCQNRFLMLCEPSLPIYNKNHGTCFQTYFMGGKLYIQPAGKLY